MFTIFQKKLPPLKRILALPAWGQKCLILEVQPFEIKNFDLGHPVLRGGGNLNRTLIGADPELTYF